MKDPECPIAYAPTRSKAFSTRFPVLWTTGATSAGIPSAFRPVPEVEPAYRWLAPAVQSFRLAVPHEKPDLMTAPPRVAVNAGVAGLRRR